MGVRPAQGISSGGLFVIGHIWWELELSGCVHAHSAEIQPGMKQGSDQRQTKWTACMASAQSNSPGYSVEWKVQFPRSTRPT